MPSAPSTKGHGFEPLSYAVIGACIFGQKPLGLHRFVHTPEEKEGA